MYGSGLKIEASSCLNLEILFNIPPLTASHTVHQPSSLKGKALSGIQTNFSDGSLPLVFYYLYDRNKTQMELRETI